jgi:glycerol-3-phosphate dehydrogenase subunit B
MGEVSGRTAKVKDLPLLHHFRSRELYSTDAAIMFDDLDWTAENARSWKPLLIGAKSLALPAVLGLRNHIAVREVMEEILAIPVYEIPTLPPSVPGLRLEVGMREVLMDKSVRIIEGPGAVGRVRQRGQSVVAAGAILESAGRKSTLDSRATILATGSMLHGGLIAAQNGRIYEPVFNIPVEAGDNRSQWVQPSAFDNQNYATFGIAVNSHMQPLDVHGDVMLENLYAVGGILQGADRSLEGSRQGIDIATSFCAVDHLARSLT